MQHLLDYNDRPDLGPEDREMVIEDMVRIINYISIRLKCASVES